jgi:hypothetical protein
MKEKEDAETQARLQKELAGMTPEQRAARDSVQILVIVIETKYFHLSSLLINSKRVKSFLEGENHDVFLLDVQTVEACIYVRNMK